MGLVQMLKRSVAKKADGVGTAVSAGTGAVAMSQFPMYLTQYLSQLRGFISGAKFTAEKYNVPQAAEDVKSYQEGLEAITNAPEGTKFFSFLFNMNTDVAYDTLVNFTPGVPFTEECGIYAAVGAAAAFGLYAVAKGVVMLPFRKKNPKGKGLE